MKRIDKNTLQTLSERDRRLYNRALGIMSVWDYLITCDVALEGHFVFSGSGHGNVYINIRDLKTISLLAPIAMQIAFEVRQKIFDVVIGTPHGADTLAVLVAYYYTLFTEQDVEVLKPLKSGNGLVWYKDHGSRVQGARILQVEDVVNSAKSLCETAEFIKDSKGNLCVIATVCNRRSDKNPGLDELKCRLDVQSVFALAEVDAVNYTIDSSFNIIAQCPLCREGVLINTRVGHGKKFLNSIEKTYPLLHKLLIGQ